MDEWDVLGDPEARTASPSVISSTSPSGMVVQTRVFRKPPPVPHLYRQRNPATRAWETWEATPLVQVIISQPFGSIKKT